MSARVDAVVVGAGPNGLAAAAVLARAGQKVRVYEASATAGGGARTAELTLPGFLHDPCSAIHPMGVASPVFKALELEKHGLTWRHPEIPYAQTLEHGNGAAAYRSLDETADALGPDGPAWKGLMKPFVDAWDTFSDTFYSPIVRVPKRPLLMARFGLHGIQPAVRFAQELFETEAARALFGGCAGHSLSSLRAPMTTSFGLGLALQAHAVGWPAAQGGSQKIADALLRCLTAAGGELVTSSPVRTLRELPEAKVVLFDVTPAQVSAICDDALPPRFHRAARRFRRGPGVFKLDYALKGPMPWTAEPLRRAGTVHVGGSLTELAESEDAVAEGRLPQRPYLLVAQQSLFDARAPQGQHTLWAYCHVPNGSTADMTDLIEAQLERFAPGFKQLVLARHVRDPRGFEAYNEAYPGGDISGGALDLMQLVFRPWPRVDPYATENPRLFLCGQSTPPGPAVHGMCGYWAAQSALKRLRVTSAP